MRFKIIRIYYVHAYSKRDALVQLNSMKPNEQETLMTDEFAVIEKSKGFVGALKKQLFG